MTGRSDRWVKLYIRLQENPIWDLSATTLKVFIGCLLKANYKDVQWYDGKQNVAIPRGSFVTSYERMAEFTGHSPKEIRTAFSHLERLGIAAYTRASHYTIVSLCNYETYQGGADADGQGHGQRNGQSKGRATGKARAGQGATDIESVEVVEALRETAERICARHPLERRCAVSQAAKRLHAIISKLPASERLPKLQDIEAYHAELCASPDWTKESGRFAKGLENWLVPTMGRFNRPTVAVASPAPIGRRSPYVETTVPAWVGEMTS